MDYWIWALAAGLWMLVVFDALHRLSLIHI